MKLIIQPDDGVKPLVKGIKAASKSIDIVIFRFDQPEIEKALEAAVARGVAVRALIAHTNRGGEKTLRKLETENERLQVEKRAQATPGRVEKLARDQLQMRAATPAITQYVTLQGVAGAAK